MMNTTFSPNVHNCTQPPSLHFDHIPASYVHSMEFLAPAITLVLFNVVVIGGNSLVITAVFTSKKLRGVTNTYIVSLAFSDLLLGMFVLPFSSAIEVSNSCIDSLLSKCKKNEASMTLHRMQYIL